MRFHAVMLLVCCVGLFSERQTGQAVADGEWLHQSREPLIDRRGNVAFEGRRIKLASDTYPRAAARLVEGPEIRRDDGGMLIRFALDKPDDVLVRVVDADGRVVRNLGCGVLGPDVPEPFQKDSLQQEILWDGNDGQGQYVDMVYPSDPAVLADSGRKIEDVWPFVARFDGLAIPHRPRSWPSFAPYSSDWRIPYPMRIASDGTVYFGESTTGFPRWSAGDERLRIFTTHVDRFWFLEMMPLMWSMGPMAIDDGDSATSSLRPPIDARALIRPLAHR